MTTARTETPLILAINGSPRSEGNTESLIAAFIDGGEKAGARVESIAPARLKISPCISCGGCEKTGECVIGDEMGSVYPRLLAADIIVLGSPLFFMGPPAQLKMLIDRTQALWAGKFLLGASYKKRDCPRWGFLLGVGATPGSDRIFGGLIRTAKSWFSTLDVEYKGDLLVNGVDQKGAIKDTDAGKRAYEEARSLVKKWRRDRS